MNRRLPTLVLVLVFFVLSACASTGGARVSTKKRDAVLQNYAAAVRWNEFDQAWSFVEPGIRAERNLSDLERERYKQVQVVGYDVRTQAIAPDGMSLEQVIDIRLVNRNTQVERTVVDHQRWTYDPIAKRWWLVSGLPDITAD